MRQSASLQAGLQPLWVGDWAGDTLQQLAETSLAGAGLQQQQQEGQSVAPAAKLAALSVDLHEAAMALHR